MSSPPSQFPIRPAEASAAPGARPRVRFTARSLRPLSLTPIATILYLLTLGLALYQLDRQNYQAAKAEIIRENFYELFPQRFDESAELATLALYGTSPAIRSHSIEQLKTRLHGLVDGPTSFYEVDLLDADDQEIVRVSDLGKPGRLDTWHNTLLLPGFNSKVERAVTPPGASAANLVSKGPNGGRAYGRLFARYSTPPGYPAIVQLTSRYRSYTVALALVWIAGYAFLYLRILRPMRRVTARLAEGRDEVPRLIRSPAVLLEANYNLMASQALLQILQERLTALLRPADAGGAPKGQVVAAALAAIRDWFGVQDIIAGEIAVPGGDVEADGAESPPAREYAVSESYLPDAISASDPNRLLQAAHLAGIAPGSEDKRDPAEEFGGAGEGSCFAVADNGIIGYAGRLGVNSWLVVTGRIAGTSITSVATGVDSSRHHTGAVSPTVANPAQNHSEPESSFSKPCESRRVGVAASVLVPGAATDSGTRLDAVRRACDALRRGLLAYRAIQHDVFRQKSDANIVLSRNLGHDLTNIIATTKLDLMAVRRLLAAPASAGASPGAIGLPPIARPELLQEAVRGLLESTKFLQEIVNIYRSFSNVKRPQYERRDLNGLVEEFLKAFEPSVSSKVELRREFADGMPPPIIEPRLLKLALFNVLTNALDAHKKSNVGRVGLDGASGLPVSPGSVDGSPNPTPPAGTMITAHAPARIVVRTVYDVGASLYRIEIDDNGPGIRDAMGRLLAPAEVDAIFRLGYSTKETEASEGLGLSWVRTIIEQFHDGRVRAENLSGAGARMTLGIRSMDSAEAKIPPPSEASHPARH